MKSKRFRLKKRYFNTRSALVLMISGLFFLGRPLFAQVKSPKTGPLGTVSLNDELRSLYDMSLLPVYRTGSKVAQISSYDTTGGNDDGFSGRYSFLKKSKDSDLVIFDVKGCGVIDRIWTPTPTSDTLDFYLDEQDQATFSISFQDLFSGKVFPFVGPLCGNELGGYYCYLPMPFQKGCRIVYRGKRMQFYQIQYRLYPQGTKVKKFDLPLDEGEKEALKKVAARWDDPIRSMGNVEGPGQAVMTKTVTLDIQPGETKSLFNLHTGGRILGLEMDPADAFKGSHNLVDLKITWDQEHNPAVYCPVADFFGYAFGAPSMQSLLLGTQNNQNYCYFPMPFDRDARIELVYRHGATGREASPIKVNAKLWYTQDKRAVQAEGKLYTHWNSQQSYGENEPHAFLDIQGKGHYVGTLLQAQGLQPGMTIFFEGDDSTAVDGEPRMHGTGSEDYFNGGWYALLDRWDTKISLPNHGSLAYSLPLARTGGYRLFLSDKISFEKALFHSIEHGPTGNKTPVHYTSLAFYYSNTPVPSFLQPSAALTQVLIPKTLIIYPQLMKFSLGGHVDFKFDGPLVMTADNGSVVRIDLEEIPYGKYQLYMDLDRFPEGGEFSVWQRQSQRSGWISSYQKKEERVPELYLCDVEVKDFKNTLTFRFRTLHNRKGLKLNRLIFKRISDERDKE